MAKENVKQPNDASNGSVFFSQVFNVFYFWQRCEALTDAIKDQPLSFQPSVTTTSSYLTDMCLGYACIIVTVVMWGKNDHCKVIISNFFAREICFRSASALLNCPEGWLKHSNGMLNKKYCQFWLLQCSLWWAGSVILIRLRLEKFDRAVVKIVFGAFSCLCLKNFRSAPKYLPQIR